MADEKKPNVFLTWSGDRSAAVASALRDWLPEVVQQCRPWMSAADIYAGKRWRGEVRQRLDDIRVGVLCLTPENVAKPWVNFEAGALSRAFGEDDRVIPYCFGFKPTDYSDPLGDFQGVEADEAGTLKVVQSINATMPDPLPAEVVLKIFTRAYGDLKNLIDRIPLKVPDAPPKRSVENYFEEVILRMRRLEASTDALVIQQRTGKGLMATLFESPAFEGLGKSIYELGQEVARRQAAGLPVAIPVAAKPKPQEPPKK